MAKDERLPDNDQLTAGHRGGAGLADDCPGQAPGQLEEEITPAATLTITNRGMGTVCTRTMMSSKTAATRIPRVLMSTSCPS